MSDARLYFDASCGPCRLFAHAAAGLARGRLRVYPYDGREAASELSDLDEQHRWSLAHLVDADRRFGGAEILRPLTALVFGAAAERVVCSVPLIDRGLRAVYGRFWNHRRVHGCGTGAARYFPPTAAARSAVRPPNP